MDSKSISRRGFLAGTALVAGLGALAAMPTAAQAVTKYGSTKTYTGSQGHTGSVSCYLDYDTSGYIRFTSRFKVSYPCIAGSVKCNTTIMGGTSIAKSGNYVNGSQSSEFMHRIMAIDLSNPYYGGYFSGSSIWRVASYGLTCYSDTIYYQMDQGLPDPTAVAAANEALAEAVGINGKKGFVRKKTSSRLAVHRTRNAWKWQKLGCDISRYTTIQVPLRSTSLRLSAASLNR